MRQRPGDGAGRGRRPAGRRARARGRTACPASRRPGTAPRPPPAGSAARCSGRRRTSTPAWSPGAGTTGAPTGPAREEVFAVVDAAFAQRRKTLRSALAGLAGSPGGRRGALRAAGVDPGARGEQLAVDDFARDRRRHSPRVDDRHRARGDGPGAGQDQPQPRGSGRVRADGFHELATRLPRGRPRRRGHRDGRRRRAPYRSRCASSAAQRSWRAARRHQPGRTGGAAAARRTPACPAAGVAPRACASRSRSPAAWPAARPTRRPRWWPATRCGATGVRPRPTARRSAPGSARRAVRAVRRHRRRHRPRRATSTPVTARPDLVLGRAPPAPRAVDPEVYARARPRCATDTPVPATRADRTRRRAGTATRARPA